MTENNDVMKTAIRKFEANGHGVDLTPQLTTLVKLKLELIWGPGNNKIAIAEVNQQIDSLNSMMFGFQTYELRE